MELVKAIKQVMKICPKGASEFAHVCLCSATDQVGAHVYATDGVNFIVVFVDVDLPTAVLPVELLKPVLKEMGDIQVSNLGYGVIEFKTAVGVTKIQGKNYDSYPRYPDLPEMNTRWNASEVQKVLHAAGTEKHEPQFAVVNFTMDCAEAYAGSRFARIALSNSWAGLVSVKLFKSWTKGGTVMAHDSDFVFFRMGDTSDRVGEEIRIGQLQRQHYPDTAVGIPREFTGNRIVVDTAGLKSAINASLGVSKSNFVRFRIEDILKVFPFGVENHKGKDVICDYSNSYCASIPIQYCFQPEVKACTLNLNGKYVQDALKQVKTHNVIVGYGLEGDTHHPLRIESAGFTACVWQLVT